MSSKTVKITNGKILNYTIFADGYKTVNGSKLITSNDPININMLPSTSANGIYSLGDRLGGIASFAFYFNATNPETNVDTTYAVFVSDAQYRAKKAFYYTSGSLNPNLPIYNTDNAAKEAPDSATFNTNHWVAMSNYSATNYPAVAFARELSITVGNETYYGQIPSLKELISIKAVAKNIDDNDPTLSSYSSNSLETWNIGGNSSSAVWSSTLYGQTSAGNYYVGSGGTVTPAYFTGQYGVVPIFEIPVN